MKFLHTIWLLLILVPSFAVAQRNDSQQTSLTRELIRKAERRLSDMGYWTGAVDGVLDPATRAALVAFQKWEGRAITGRLTIDEVEAIRTSAGPKARELGYEHVEVDLDRQVLLLVNHESGVRVLPVSTGTGKPFLDEGQTSIAYTPRGRFIVYRKGIGWETGPDRKSTRLNSSHVSISYAVFCLKKKKKSNAEDRLCRTHYHTARHESRP